MGFRLSLAEALGKSLAEINALTGEEIRLWAAFYKRRMKEARRAENRRGRRGRA